MPRTLRIATRGSIGSLHFLAGLAIVLGLFPFLGVDRRERIIAAWSRGLLKVFGLQVVEHVAEGGVALAHTPAGAMLLVNHVHWLDVFVVLAHAPASFVSKSEVATWPLVGALVRGVGTLFLERGRRHAVHQLNQRIETLLSAGRRVAVFPEGTTSDGNRLLKFHANLIEPAVQAGAPIVPVGLRYRTPEGEPTDAMLFVGDATLGDTLTRVLGAPGVRVEVHLLPAVEAPAPMAANARHAVAQLARLALHRQLALPLDEETPETLQRATRARSAV